MPTYSAVIDGGNGGTREIEAESLREALDQAAAWARDGDWPIDDRTIWVRVEVTATEADEDDYTESGSIRVAIDPEEPECDGGTEHDWQSPVEIVGGIAENPGVWGHGGGVTITECCMHCGCARMTDTWAQDPETGEQGLESVSYEPGRYADEIPRRAERDLEDEIGSREMLACAAYLLASLRDDDRLPDLAVDATNLSAFLESLAPRWPVVVLDHFREHCAALSTSGHERRRLAWLRDFSQFVSASRCDVCGCVEADHGETRGVWDHTFEAEVVESAGPRPAERAEETVDAC